LRKDGMSPLAACGEAHADSFSGEAVAERPLESMV
jgi:hypothetical protein